MSKNFNLREFQTRLSQQLQAAASRDTSGSRLGFSVGDSRWLVTLSDTEEVLPVPSLLKVPGARRWFRGLANLRGNLYAVSDFADFMGLGVTPESSDCRLLIPHRDFGVNAALLIGGTLGLRNIARFQPADAVDSRPWVGQHYRDDDETVWRDLDFGVLLGTPAFLMVEATAAV